ncbi:MAG: hypothetical protein EPO21_12950 [Chloroflexota bacterium]|nr:MAG: hypothetical protein EPO21_12950 [Chloroflexota bacterium]
MDDRDEYDELMSGTLAQRVRELEKQVRDLREDLKESRGQALYVERYAASMKIDLYLFWTHWQQAHPDFRGTPELLGRLQRCEQELRLKASRAMGKVEESDRPLDIANKWLNDARRALLAEGFQFLGEPPI